MTRRTPHKGRDGKISRLCVPAAVIYDGRDMNHFAQDFIRQCTDARASMVTSVPDGYLAPLIEACAVASSITHIPAAREEECLGIAAGAAMAGGRAIAMMQNAGFLNAVGCYATLCANYRTPFLIVISHRGNIYDRNKYDIEKFRYTDAIFRTMNAFTLSWRDFRAEKNIVGMALERAYTAMEPSFLLLDFPPPEGSAC